MNIIKNIQQQLKLLSGSSRLPILHFLHKNKASTVMEIAESLNKSIYSISRDLRVLRSAKLVEFKRRGVYISYRLPLKRNPLLKVVLEEIK